MKNINWNEVPDQVEFKKLVAGGYVALITNVEDVAEKEYLKIEYDIAYGESANYYQELFDNRGFWAGRFIRSYKEKAQPMFKGFLTAIGNSNANFKFNNDEKQLVGKLVGVVLGEEEYQKNDDSIGIRLYVNSTRSVSEIKKGVEIPKIKQLAGSTSNFNTSSFGKDVANEGIPEWMK